MRSLGNLKCYFFETGENDTQLHIEVELESVIGKIFDYFDVSNGIVYAMDVAQVVPVVVACFVLEFLVVGSAVVVVVKNDPDISRQQRLEVVFAETFVA